SPESGDNNNSDVSAAVYARFGELEVIHSMPLVSFGGHNAHFGDVKGAGKLDIIQTSPSSWGYYERDTESPAGWTSFQNFSSSPNIDTANPDVKFVDLTGDGLPDLLIYQDQIYCWYPSLAADGYGPGRMVTQASSEDLGPVCVFS